MRSCSPACRAQRAAAGVGGGGGRAGGPPGLLCEAGGWARPSRGDGGGPGGCSLGSSRARVVGSGLLACCPLPQWMCPLEKGDLKGSHRWIPGLVLSLF